jgi:lipid-A-disaccharide synthase
MVIVYKLNPLSLAIAKPLIKVPYAGLCNIIAEKKVVPEFIQEEATPQNIAEEIIRLIEDENHRNTQIYHLREVNTKLNAAKNSSIGQLICQMLN